MITGPKYHLDAIVYVEFSEGVNLGYYKQNPVPSNECQGSSGRAMQAKLSDYNRPVQRSHT